MISFMRF